jgi:apoptosis-inducing factor 3
MVASNEWKEIGNLDDFPKDKPRKVTIGEEEIAVVRKDSGICACGNTCTHYGGPLSDGVYKGGNIVCPWHHARFDVATGKLQGAPALDDIPLYEVDVRDNTVFVGKKQEPEIKMPSGSDTRRFIILGGGAAAEGALEELRRKGFAGTIVVVTPENETPYDRTILSKGFVSGEMKESYLPLRKKSFYEKLNIEFKLGRKAVQLHPGKKSVSLDDGSELEGDAVLLATGSVPKDLELPRKKAENYYLLRSAGNGRIIKEAVAHSDRILLIGAGFIAMELAADLVSHGKEVHIAAPETIPMAAVFGERIGNRILRMHTEQGVRFHLGETVNEFSIKGPRLTGADLSGGDHIDIDMAVTAAGVSPVINYLGGTHILKMGAVKVNEYLETPASGIFAAGDIALVPFNGLPHPVRIEHWVNAVNQGRHAADSMLGEKNPYRSVPFFWTRQYGKSIKFSGYPLKWEQIAYRGDPDGGNFVAGFYRGNKLRATAGSGMMEEMITMEQIIDDNQDLPYGDFGKKELPI